VQVLYSERELAAVTVTEPDNVASMIEHHQTSDSTIARYRLQSYQRDGRRSS